MRPHEAPGYRLRWCSWASTRNATVASLLEATRQSRRCVAGITVPFLPLLLDRGRRLVVSALRAAHSVRHVPCYPPTPDVPTPVRRTTMKTRLILSSAAAILCAGALISAQAPDGGAQQKPAQPTTQTPTRPPAGEERSTSPRPAAGDARSTSLVGCLYREQDIPGWSPNAAEKAGIGEDYILADASTASDQSRATDRPGVGAGQPDQRRPTGPTAGLATGRMYKVTKVDDTRLRALVGKRVEVLGTVKVDDTPARDAAPGAAPSAGDRGRNLQNIPDFETASIREVTDATCPARPAGSSPAAPAPPTTPNR
jgi:hypothetical protein